MLDHRFDTNIIILDPDHRDPDIATVRDIVSKVNDTVHCVFMLINKEALHVASPIGVETPDNIDQPLGLEVSELAQALLGVLLNAIVGVFPVVLDEEFDHGLFKEARY
jgi:hypothetical protein